MVFKTCDKITSDSIYKKNVDVQAKRRHLGIELQNQRIFKQVEIT